MLQPTVPKNTQGLPAIVPILAPVATSIIGNILQNRANRKMADQAYSKDVDMWNKQNEYNDPRQQMARYTSAGLNPNLIYQSGSASAGNSAQMPRYSAPTMEHKIEAPNIMPTMGMFLDLQAKQAGIDRIKAETEGQNLSNRLALANFFANTGIMQNRWKASEYMPFNEEWKGKKLQADTFMQLLQNDFFQRTSNDRAGIFSRQLENLAFSGMLTQAQIRNQSLIPSLQRAQLKNYQSQYQKGMLDVDIKKFIKSRMSKENVAFDAIGNDFLSSLLWNLLKIGK